MNQSQKFYEFASAVSDLSYNTETETENIGSPFYAEAMRAVEDETVESVHEDPIDNIVVDPSIPISAYLNSDKEASFEIYDERMFDALNTIYGTDLGLHWEESNNPREDYVGAFKDSVTPEEIFSNLGDLGDDYDLHVPDHMTDCINGARDSLFRDLRSNELQYERQLLPEGEVMPKSQIDMVRNLLVTGFNDVGLDLPVMSNSGIFDGYSDANFNRRDVNEDDLIAREARELQGNTVVATFDTDFLEKDVTAFPPNLINALWN